MAKNKMNNFKTGGAASGKSTAGSAGQSTSSTKDSTKNSHAQVSDNSPKRSGPGGE